MSSPLFSFTILDSVDSTNNYAMANVHEGKTNHGNAYFTGNQISGKGQRGRVWQSTAGLNIALSVVVEPQKLNITQQFQLSASVALAAFEFFSKYAGSETKVKWPNDIYWRDRKAGGILIENVFRGNNWKHSIIGIGLNINQTSFAEDIKNPVSLKQITGKTHNITELAKELHLHIMQKAAKLSPDFLDEFNKVLYKLNETVKLKQQSRVFEATINGVDNNGRLITYTSTEERFDFGEISWIL